MKTWDGTYRVEFESNLRARGVGALQISGNNVWGGDDGFAYRGRVLLKGGIVTGRVRITKVTPGAVSVFGPVDYFELVVAGRAIGNYYQFSGEVVGWPTMRLRFNLRRAWLNAAE